MRRAIEETPDPMTDGIIGPNAILPEQFSAVGTRVQTGEQRLMVAVLEAAVDDYHRFVRRNPRGWQRRVGRDAARWFASNDRTWVYSFFNVAESLGLDPQAIRDAIRRPQVQSARVEMGPEPAYRLAVGV